MQGHDPAIGTHNVGPLVGNVCSLFWKEKVL